MTVTQIVASLEGGGRWRVSPHGNKQALEVKRRLGVRGYRLAFLTTIKTRGGQKDVWIAERF